MAARTQAVEWRDGQLLVEVFGAVWMAELTLQKRTLIAHIQQVTGNEAVTSLHFVPASRAMATTTTGSTSAATLEAPTREATTLDSATAVSPPVADTAPAPHAPNTSNASTTGRRPTARPRKNPKGV